LTYLTKKFSWVVFGDYFLTGLKLIAAQTSLNRYFTT
jgi:hypothetical protein